MARALLEAGRRSGILTDTVADATDDTSGLPLGPVLGLLREWWALDHAIERASRRMASRLGVTAPQRIALRLIGRYPGIGPGALAGLLHLDAGTISATIRRLEDVGFVKRRPSTHDRRRVSLALTAKGRALDVDDEQTIEGALGRVVASAPTSEVAAMRAFLARFADELDREAPGGSAELRSEPCEPHQSPPPLTRR